MIEFNADGSIKLPGKLAKKKADDTHRMRNTRCATIRKEIVSTYAPKSCILHITLSDRLTDNRFVENIYREFDRDSEVPSKLVKVNEKEFRIEIGTCFRRCSDCTSLIHRYRSFLDSNAIEQQGGCTYRQNIGSGFSYEDHFD